MRARAGGGMVQLVVNGDSCAVAPGTALGTLVDTLVQSRGGVAAARNGEVVPRSQWDATVVQPGDHIELLSAAQGG